MILLHALVVVDFLKHLKVIPPRSLQPQLPSFADFHCISSSPFREGSQSGYNGEHTEAARQSLSSLPAQYAASFPRLQRQRVCFRLLQQLVHIRRI